MTTYTPVHVHIREYMLYMPWTYDMGFYADLSIFIFFTLHAFAFMLLLA